MKNISFFSFILSLTFLLATPACEKSIDQTQVSVVDQNGQITTREEADCSICPLDCCCCCLIEMVGFITFDLEICGLCEGDYLCGPFSPNTPCSAFSGSGKDFMFIYPGSARQTICVAPGASIRIRNSGITPASFRFTCEPHLSPPPYVNVSLPNNGDVAYFYNNGTCMVAGCP